MSIEIRNISKTFGAFSVLQNVNVSVKTGELVALLGPSGCGKTTLLRIIAGLETADQGAVYLNGEAIKDRSVRDRQVGFVFQHYALFRHMTVFENVAFGLRVRPRSRRQTENTIRQKVHDLLKLVQLEWLADRYPAQLSGGQRQRIALARALAVEPKMLLLDEPFGALDPQVRKELRRWLRRLHDEIRITSIFVTHDQEEALELAHSVVVMNQGRIEQIGTPDEVYERPATPFVYTFLGNVNLFSGRAHDGRARLGNIEIPIPNHIDSREGLAVGYVRVHDIDIHRELNRDDSISANISRIRAFGTAVRLELTRQDTGEPIEAELTKDRLAELNLLVGDSVFITPRNMRVFVQNRAI